jgi:hypothetical protein
VKRICKNCKHSIRKRDRWKVVHHRFLFFHWTTTVHHNCTAPVEAGQSAGPHSIIPN